MAEGQDKISREAADWLARMRGPGADASREALAAWRAADPAHDDAYRRAERNWERSAFAASIPSARNRDLSRAAVWHCRPGARAAAAACLAVFALGSVTWLTIGQRTAPAATAVRLYASRVGEVKAVTLTDGTVLTLDADSAVRVSFSPAERLSAVVRGRVRFAVAPEPSIPFVVTADALAVRARDATFDVELAPDFPRVSLLRGDASWYVGGASGKPAVWFKFVAGQQVDGQGAGKRRDAPAGSFGWTKGMLAFDGERLDAAIATFNRYNRQKLAVADDATAGRRITGAFHANDPQSFAAAIAAMFGTSVTRTTDGTLVIGASTKR